MLGFGDPTCRKPCRNLAVIRVRARTECETQKIATFDDQKKHLTAACMGLFSKSDAQRPKTSDNYLLLNDFNDENSVL